MSEWKAEAGDAFFFAKNMALKNIYLLFCLIRILTQVKVMVKGYALLL